MTNNESSTEATKIELRNCPFCGATNPYSGFNYDIWRFQIHCNQCGGNITATEMVDAIRLWNSRPASACGKEKLTAIFKEIRKKAVEKSGWIEGDSTLQNQVRGYQMTFALEMIEELQKTLEAGEAE